jgi:hypothetical protein
VIGGLVVYRDHHHLTATFARSLSGLLDDRLLSPPTPWSDDEPGITDVW